jgi:hypothetical protein
MGGVPPSIVPVYQPPPPAEASPNTLQEYPPIDWLYITSNHPCPREPRYFAPPRRIAPRPWQVPHIDRCVEIIQTRHGWIDCSRMGAGKSYCGIAVAQRVNLPVLIIGTVSSHSAWEKALLDSGWGCYGLISYDILSSRTKNDRIRHGLLQKKSVKDGRGGVKVEYEPTDFYRGLLERGILLIVDECQKAKTATTFRGRAINTMVSTLIRSSTKSRFALIGTLFTHECHAINFLEVIGLLQPALDDKEKKMLANYSEPEEQRNRVQGLLNMCCAVDVERTTSVWNGQRDTFFSGDKRQHRKKLAHLCLELYDKVLKHSLSSATLPPPHNGFDIRVGNLEVDLNEHEYPAVLQAAQRFVELSEMTGQSYNLGRVGKAHIQLEVAMVPVYFRLARQILRANYLAKIVIGCNYKQEVLDKLAGLFRAIGIDPLLMIGETNDPTRKEVLRLFQAPGSLNRVLLITVRTAESYSLHDEHGYHPRYFLGGSSYFIENMHQCVGRFVRDIVRSNCYVFWVYAKNIPPVATFLKSAAEASGVMRGAQVGNELVKYPAEYTSFTEKDLIAS